jgi:hypothetical protein
MVIDSRGLEIVGYGSNAMLADTVQSLTGKNVELSARISELEAALRVVQSIPPAPESEPATKTFKVEAPKAAKK